MFKQVIRRRKLSLVGLTLAFVLVLSSYQYYENSRLNAKYTELASQYNELNEKHNALDSRYQTLSQEYERLKRVALLPPYSSISGGQIKWVLYDLRGNTITWTMPVDTYRGYVTQKKSQSLLSFSTTRGTTRTYDVRPYIQPSFFQKIIGDLTTGRSDRDFVKEVDNVKNQITVYHVSLGDAPYQFPAETLTEGRGMCADTTILMTSMLIQGNRQANYGFRVSVLYVYLSNDGTLQNTPLADTNHVIVGVYFRDGTCWYIETTGNQFSSYSQTFYAYEYDITTIYG